MGGSRCAGDSVLATVGVELLEDGRGRVNHDVHNFFAQVI